MMLAETAINGVCMLSCNLAEVFDGESAEVVVSVEAVEVECGAVPAAIYTNFHRNLCCVLQADCMSMQAFEVSI